MTLHDILTYPEKHPWIATLGTLALLCLRVALSYGITAPSNTRIGRARDWLDALLPLDVRKIMAQTVRRIDNHTEVPDDDADTIPPAPMAPHDASAPSMFPGGSRANPQRCERCGKEGLRRGASTPP